MEKNKTLVISNTGLSNTESNGRILSLLFNDWDDGLIHNYCVGGCPDKGGVNYIFNSDLSNLKSLLSFGFVKPRTFSFADNKNNDSNETNASVKTNKKAIHYFIRNILYIFNFHISKFLKKYIIRNQIKKIFLFGTDAPYMYRLARVLSKKCGISLEIYTCEDYPLKNYNYIQGGKHNHNIFFKLLMRSLKKQTRKAYAVSTKCSFNSELLLEDYKKVFKLNNPTVRYLPSVLEKVNYKPREIRHIVYGGNLYFDRVNSLLDISKVLAEINKEVVLDVYGKTNTEDALRLKNCPNINYHGVVSYARMIGIYKNADMLLHVDGFSEYSILDCKHAFSTKISDCYLLGIPFFIYAPIEIASTQYAYKMNKLFTATSFKELEEKLNDVINNRERFTIDYGKIEEDFGAIG